MPEEPIPVNLPEEKSVNASGADTPTQLEETEKLPVPDPFLVQFDEDDPADPHVRRCYPVADITDLVANFKRYRIGQEREDGI